MAGLFRISSQVGAHSIPRGRTPWGWPCRRPAPRTNTRPSWSADARSNGFRRRRLAVHDRFAAKLAATGLRVRARPDAVALLDAAPRRSRRAEHARRESREVAPRAHDMVLRALRAARCN